MTRLAIDGDLVVYPAAAVNQTVYYVAIAGLGSSLEIIGEVLGMSRLLGPLKKEFVGEVGIEYDHFIVPQPFGYVRHTIDQTMEAMIKATGADGFDVYLTENPTFRHQIATIKP